MSYVIHIWEDRLPRSLRESAEDQMRLGSRLTYPNPKWRRLRDEVESRMTALGLETIWGEMPFDIDNLDRVYGLEVDGQPEGFLRTLVRVATSLGFCVLDDVAAICYLPFGIIFTHDGRKRLKWIDDTATPVTTADREAVMARCVTAWQPRFEALGFTLRRDDPFRDEIPWLAERESPAGRQIIRIAFSTCNDALSFSVRATLNPVLPDPVRAIPTLTFIQVRGSELRGMSAFMDSSRWSMLSIGGSLETSEHVDRAVDAVFEYLDDEILPTFEACSTHAGILRLALDDKGKPGYLVPSEMILAMAWMEGDDMLERLHAAYRTSDPDWEGNAKAHAALKTLAR